MFQNVYGFHIALNCAGNTCQALDPEINESIFAKINRIHQMVSRTISTNR
jgi:hypothetical protein